MLQKKKQINFLTEQLKQEENKINQKKQINQTEIEQKDMIIQSLLIKYKNMENEIKKKK